jgi:hypothetical protein
MQEDEMIFGGLEFVVGAKLLAAHGAHVLATKGALAAQHPLSTATHMAINHTITSAINNPAVYTATTVPHVPVLTPGPVAAVLSHGTTGAAGTATASPVTVKVLHIARELAMPVVTGVVLGQVRKTELYRGAKATLSELLGMVREELRPGVTS